MSKDKSYSSDGELSRADALKRLMEDVSKDPELLHGLLFEPEATLGKLSYLGRREKGAILAMRPEWVIAGLAGLTFGRGGTVAVCGHSCSDSCDDTCGGGSCFGTCFSSCDHTCGARSCDITTEIASFRLGGDPPLDDRFGAQPFRAWRR